MYQIGQRVIYGIHGVCQIVDISIKSVGRDKVRYYMLEPVEQPGSRYYIPTEKPAAVAKLSPILSRQDLDALLQEELHPEEIWIEDENQRKNKYRELISSGDRRALLAMIHALHLHKSKQAELGRKFHLCDENFLRDAERLLASEFAMVLNKSLEETVQYIVNAIQ